MIQFSKIQLTKELNINDSIIDEIHYKDKTFDGFIEIYFIADYEKVDTSFTHEFGIKNQHHYEAQNVKIELVTFCGIYKEGTNEEAELELTINYSDKFEELAEQIQELDVNE